MFLYLASPYSSPITEVREQRYRAACRATAALIRAGAVVFSPIAHSHALAQHGLPGDWTFWERFDRAYIERSDLLVVLMLDGWKTSVGVQAEIRIARELGKPVSYLEAPGSWSFSSWVEVGCHPQAAGTTRRDALAGVSATSRCGRGKSPPRAGSC